jgi:hypothetical protein
MYFRLRVLGLHLDSECTVYLHDEALGTREIASADGILQWFGTCGHFLICMQHASTASRTLKHQVQLIEGRLHGPLSQCTMGGHAVKDLAPGSVAMYACD